MTNSSTKKVLRFRRSERLLHWFIVVPFIICYTSALILFLVYNPDPSRPYRAVFSWIHRLSGACLVVLPPVAIVSHLNEIGVHIRNLREGWVWSLHEIKWLFLFGLSIFNKKIQLPEENKFNAAEKINFMMVMVAYVVFGSTGLTIWALDGALLPWILHFAMAAFMTPLMMGHIYMATINPASRSGLSGMISGYVDAHWASHHYRRWYKREHGEPASTPLSTSSSEPQQASAPVHVASSQETDPVVQAFVPSAPGVPLPRTPPKTSTTVSRPIPIAPRLKTTPTTQHSSDPSSPFAPPPNPDEPVTDEGASLKADLLDKTALDRGRLRAPTPASSRSKKTNK